LGKTGPEKNKDYFLPVLKYFSPKQYLRKRLAKFAVQILVEIYL
jgi:hypothetical protein